MAHFSDIFMQAIARFDALSPFVPTLQKNNKIYETARRANFTRVASVFLSPGSKYDVSSHYVSDFPPPRVWRTSEFAVITILSDFSICC